MGHEEETAIRFRREDEGFGFPRFPNPQRGAADGDPAGHGVRDKVGEQLALLLLLDPYLTLTAAVSFNTA